MIVEFRFSFIQCLTEKIKAFPTLIFQNRIDRRPVNIRGRYMVRINSYQPVHQAELAQKGIESRHSPETIAYAQERLVVYDAEYAGVE